MDLSLEKIYDWFIEQVQYFVLIVAIILMLVCAYKRAWIAMVGVVIGIAGIGIFIWNPDMLKNLALWFSDQFS